MKAILVFLFVCLAWNGSAQTNSPYNPDSLKKGDWLLIESVHYYPFIAPGLQEEVPWRAENIQRVIFRATITDINAQTLTVDYTLENMYDCRNDNEKPGFYYFDSRYRQDFALEDNVSGKQISHVTYDRKSKKALTFDNANACYSYSRTYIPFGVRQEGLSAYPATILQDTLNLEKILAPITKDLLTTWKKDGTILSMPSTRIIEASFALPPNTEFTCNYFNHETSKNSTIHKKIFISYPTEYEVGKGTILLLTPGDSITQNGTDFQGRGCEQNNLHYGFQRFIFDFNKSDLSDPDQLEKAFQRRNSEFQSTLKNDFAKMDPYWLRTFELAERYGKGALILSFYMDTDNKEVWHKSGLIDWNAPHFASINPLIDFAYSLQKVDAAYSFFLYKYSSYKKMELKSDNLSFDPKQKELTPEEDYILNKQILSGYPKYLVNKINLRYLMNEKMLCETEEDYNDFISSCPDTSLTNEVKNKYKKLLPFEAGNNIRETGLLITDSLHLVKGSDQKYILLYLSTGGGLSPQSLQDARDLQKLLQKKGLASDVQLKLYARFARYNYQRVAPFKSIPEKQLQDLNYNLGMNYLAILMREDGTILRRFGELNPPAILKCIQEDISNRDNGIADFMKGFKEGLFWSLLIGGLIGGLVVYLLNAKKKREQRRRQINELELRAIRSQMNPHFIFNALSSIQNLINRSANKEANEYLVNFSRLLRKVLATSEKKLVPLSDEIEQIQLYLKLEQLRFPFSYSLEVDQNIEPDVIEIPGMLIQPFLENAVKHGISPRGTGVINIHISMEKQLLVIDIIDDGPGLTHQEGGFGIRAISNQFELLKTLYNTEIGITIENRQDKENTSGCRVHLSIPL